MADTPVVLVDGSSYLFRAFHALPPLVNSKGMPTGAAKGVVNMMRSLKAKYPESPIVVIFDAKGPTFRNEMYSEYKANRPPMPDELRVQIEPIHNMIKAMGFPFIMVPGVEADDVIGTLAVQATKRGQACIISTGDKDMAQLVTPQVTLMNTMKNEFLDVEGVKEKYGFAPELMIDYLALMGDKVDNIPGVPGVGDKTAKALIAGLGSIENIYQNLEKIKDLEFRGAKTMAKKMEAHQEMAVMSYELATIKCDVELDQTIEQYQNSPQDDALLLSYFEEMEFKGWIKSLGGDVDKKPASAASQTQSKEDQSTDESQPQTFEPFTIENPEYKCVISLEGLTELVNRIKREKRVGIWMHFEGEHYLQNNLVGIALSCEKGTGFYVPLISDDPAIETQLTQEQVLNLISPLLSEYDVAVSCFNFKNFYHQLQNLNIEISHVDQDVLLQAFVLDSAAKRHGSLDKHFSATSLDSLIRTHIDENCDSIVEVAGKFGKKQLPLSAVELEKLTPYIASRADHVLRLGEYFSKQIRQDQDLTNVYQLIELPLSPILAQIERNGTWLDVPHINKISSDFKLRMRTYLERAHELAGEEFNLDSPKQLGEVLFTKLELPVLKKTPTGQPSTNEEVLNELALTYELPQIILEYRHLKKLVSTYTDPLPLLVQNDGRIHTSYHQTGAQTGRLSSTEPNLQNIPIRSDEGRAIRQSFSARKGYKIVAADYSQVELRIMAHLSKDDNLKWAFSHGEDVHKATASEVFGVELTDVTSDMRRSAKAINFGLIYGMSAFGLANQLNISRGEAKEYVESYFARYPGVARYMDETKMDANENGFVKTIFGRKLNLPDINSSKGMLRAAAERTAINAPMQGTAADIIKMAMQDVQIWLRSENIDGKLIMQVHDELVFEVKEEQAEQLAKGVVFRMQHAASLGVPLIVDYGIGDNWEEAH